MNGCWMCYAVCHLIQSTASKSYFLISGVSKDLKSNSPSQHGLVEGLHVARKVKGITELEIAEVLNIDESEYKELESGIKRMTTGYADVLGEIFNVEPECFMTYEYGSMQDLTDTLEKHRNLLDVAEYKQTDGKIHLAIARMGLEASIAIQENYALVRENRELEKENHALRGLYEDLKNRKSFKPRKAGKSEVSKK